MNLDELSRELQEFLRESKRVAVLGIGNELRSDDGLGPFIVNSLEVPNPDVYVENVGSVPEAFARPLAEFGADRVILVDAADMRVSPGSFDLITKDRIGGIAISTHHLPLSFLMMYLEQETGARTVLLGVQPASIEFGEGLSPVVEDAARKIISVLRQVLQSHLRG